MSAFTPNELRFLSRHNFAESDVYDGRGESKASRQMAAKAEGKILVLASVPCREMRHQIRTRAGHCAQCRPERIAFTARETALNCVYIAGSLSGRVIKIGLAKVISQRVRQLRAERYGGFSDWSVLIHVEVQDAGTVERRISSRIEGERVFSGYIKDGRHQIATEIIRCRFSAAFEAFAESVGGINKPQRWLDRYPEYEFDGEL